MPSQRPPNEKILSIATPNALWKTKRPLRLPVSSLPISIGLFGFCAGPPPAEADAAGSKTDDRKSSADAALHHHQRTQGETATTATPQNLQASPQPDLDLLQEASRTHDLATAHLKKRNLTQKTSKPNADSPPPMKRRRHDYTPAMNQWDLELRSHSPDPVRYDSLLTMPHLYAHLM